MPCPTCRSSPTPASTRTDSSEIFAVADGVIVGTSLKVDGDTWSRVDPARAERLMDTARAIRSRSA